MKREEILKEIVKKSYFARQKALNEAAGDKKFSLGQDQAPTATAAAAPGAAGAAAGASGSGGSGGRVPTKVFALKLDFSKLKKDDKFLLTKKEYKDIGKGDDKAILVYQTEEEAEKAKVIQPALEEMERGEELKEAQVPFSKAIVALEPFPTAEKGKEEEWIFEEKEPMEELENGDNVFLKEQSSGEERIRSSELYVSEELAMEVYMVVEAKKDAPTEKSDIEILVKNDERIVSKK